MDDDAFRSLRERLNVALQKAEANIGVALSPTLYREFRDRGIIEMSNFDMLRNSIGISRLPAYQRTHFVCEDFDLAETSFRVGSLLFA